MYTRLRVFRLVRLGAQGRRARQGYGEPTLLNRDDDYIFAGKQIARWEIAEGCHGDPTQEDLENMLQEDLADGDVYYAELVANCHAEDEPDWDLIREGIKQVVENYGDDALTLLPM